jgi:hypothetical protein
VRLHAGYPGVRRIRGQALKSFLDRRGVLKMPLHFDGEIFKEDVRTLLDACKAGLTGTDRHRAFAEHLTDENNTVRRTAKFGLIANCVNCAVELACAVNVIFERGSPISLSLHDHTCPSCGSEKGFNYSKVDTFHA